LPTGYLKGGAAQPIGPFLSSSRASKNATAQAPRCSLESTAHQRDCAAHRRSPSPPRSPTSVGPLHAAPGRVRSRVQPVPLHGVSFKDRRGPRPVEGGHPAEIVGCDFGLGPWLRYPGFSRVRHRVLTIESPKGQSQFSPMTSFNVLSSTVVRRRGRGLQAPALRAESGTRSAPTAKPRPPLSARLDALGGLEVGGCGLSGAWTPLRHTPSMGSMRTPFRASCRAYRRTPWALRLPRNLPWRSIASQHQRSSVLSALVPCRKGLGTWTPFQAAELHYCPGPWRLCSDRIVLALAITSRATKSWKLARLEHGTVRWVDNWLDLELLEGVRGSPLKPGAAMVRFHAGDRVPTTHEYIPHRAPRQQVRLGSRPARGPCCNICRLQAGPASNGFTPTLLPDFELQPHHISPA